MGLFKKAKPQTTSTGVGSNTQQYFDRGFQEAEAILNEGPRVYSGQRVAGFSPETEEAFATTGKLARGNQKYLDQALSQIGQTARGRDYVPPELLDLIQSGGAQAANQAQGSVNQAFQGSGFGSPLHSILGSRAGAEALGSSTAPILANLYSQQQARQEAAIRDVPGLYNAASTGQGNILRGIGGEREALEQRQLDAQREAFDEFTVGRQSNLDSYAANVSGLGQFFRTTTGSAKKGSGLFGKIAPIAGAVIGGYFGGPAGAAAGASVGSSVSQ